MLDLPRLKRTLLALPELGLRVGWLREFMGSDSCERLAALLNALCEESERSEATAREALLPVSLLFASLGECEFVERLRACAELDSLLSLERFLRRSPASSRNGDGADDLPIPDYGGGRELTVGERRSLARRPSRQAFEKLLSDPHPLVVVQILQNPRLTEDDVVRLAARRPARPHVMAALATSERWLCRPRVRLAILLNPRTPASLAMPLLPLSTRSELAEVLRGADAPIVLRATARELFERRLPLAECDPADITLQ